MSSREDILTRVRKNLGRNATNEPLAQTAIDRFISARTPGPRPQLAGDLLMRFKEKSEALSTTVDIVANWSAVPGAIGRYLDNQGLTRRVVGWPLLRGHDWNAAGIQYDARGAVDADLVGITGCYCAIAETGTLMLLSGADTPASVSLLPETHVAILAASRIVAGMEEAWKLARTELGTLPRAVNFISGPSRTGDIEQTIVLGAHGPYRVHVVIATQA
jgi:L-lactate dehydrogenase complex protein LldG